MAELILKGVEHRAIIAVIGAGRLGRAVAKRFTGYGFDVRIGSRTSGLAYSTASAGADFVFLCTLWEYTFGTLEQLTLSPGTVVVDCTNPEAGDGPGLVPGLAGAGAEMIQASLAGIPVVKALNHVYAQAIENHTANPHTFVCANDEPASERVISLLSQAAIRATYAGGLSQSRYLENMAQLLVGMVRSMGYPADTTWFELSAATESRILPSM